MFKYKMIHSGDQSNLKEIFTSANALALAPSSSALSAKFWMIRNKGVLEEGICPLYGGIRTDMDSRNWLHMAYARAVQVCISIEFGDWERGCGRNRNRKKEGVM